MMGKFIKLTARQLKGSIWRRLSLGLMACLILVLGSVLLPAPAASAFTCPQGITQDDCDSIYGNWTPYAAESLEFIGCDADSGTQLVGNDNIEKAFNFFTGKGLTKQQAAGIAGNMYIESAGINPAIQQDGSNDPMPKNGVGFGISQWTYSDRQQPLVAFAKKAGQPVNTLAPQLGYVWHELQTSYQSALTKLKATTSVRDAAVSFMIYYEAPADHSPNGQNAHLRTDAANKILGKYGNGAISGDGTDCGGGAVAGDAVKTALRYAWHKIYTPNHFAKRAAYEAAIRKAQANGEYVGGGSHPGIDCGGFVTRVMRDSGADPNYNAKQGSVQTGIQEAYLKNNPKKYKFIGTDLSTTKLQPGDIAINDRHTFIFVGQQDGFPGNIAQAFYGGDYGHWLAPQAGIYVTIPGHPFHFYRPI